MRNFLLSIIMLGCILQAKAQQKLTDKGSFYPNLTLKTDSNWYKLSKPRTDSLLTFKMAPLKIRPLQQQNLIAGIVYDHMPIARFNGHSKMPIVQTDVTGYTMPVAGMHLPRVYYMKKHVDSVATPPVVLHDLTIPPVSLRPGN